jgi:hypothetical protein
VGQREGGGLGGGAERCVLRLRERQQLVRPFMNDPGYLQLLLWIQNPWLQCGCGVLRFVNPTYGKTVLFPVLS